VTWGARREEDSSFRHSQWTGEKGGGAKSPVRRPKKKNKGGDSPGKPRDRGPGERSFTQEKGREEHRTERNSLNTLPRLVKTRSIGADLRKRRGKKKAYV